MLIMEFDIETMYMVGGVLISTVIILVAWLSMRKQPCSAKPSDNIQKKVDIKKRDEQIDENHEQKNVKKQSEDDEANSHIEEMLDAIDNLEVHAEPIIEPKSAEVLDRSSELQQHSDSNNKEKPAFDDLLLPETDISLALENERLQLQLNAAQEDCEKLQRERDAALQRIDTNNDNERILKDEKSVLQSQLSDLQSDLADAHAHLSQTKDYLAACEQENRALTAEVDKYKVILENMKVASIRDETLRKLQANRESEDQQWNDKFLSAESILQQIRSDNQSLESELSMLQVTSGRRLLTEG